MFCLFIVFIYLQYISTVHTLMFTVKPYLSICICSLVLVFEFLYTLFYNRECRGVSDPPPQMTKSPSPLNIRQTMEGRAPAPLTDDQPI